MMLYKSLVLQVIDYADIVKMTSNLNNFGKVQKLQNFACRIVLEAERRTINKDMNAQLHLMELTAQRKYHFDIQVFKCMNNMAPDYICNPFEEIYLRHSWAGATLAVAMIML